MDVPGQEWWVGDKVGWVPPLLSDAPFASDVGSRSLMSNWYVSGLKLALNKCLCTHYV